MKTYSLLALSAALAGFTLLLGTGTPSHAGPQGLDISRLSLDVAYNPNPRTAGKLRVRGVITDDIPGSLAAELLTNTATLRVQDDAQFDVEVTLVNCITKNLRVVCVGRSGDFRVKGFFRLWRNYPEVWRMNVRVKDLGEVETGLGPLEAPVTVTLKYGGTTRTDAIGQSGGNELDCRQKKQGATRLRCKAK